MFAGRVKIVSHLACRTSVIMKYYCPLQLAKLEGAKTYRRHCGVSLSKTLNSLLSIVGSTPAMSGHY